MHDVSVMLQRDGVGGLPFVARVALLACAGGLTFITRVCLWWFPALVFLLAYAFLTMVGGGEERGCIPNHCVSL